MWVLQNWCEAEGTVRIEVNGTQYDHPAGGRCDVSDAPATLQSPLTVQPSEDVTSDWPAGTVTCAELEGDFPLGVDDHGIYLDRGLVSYYRTAGADSVEEVFIQFLDDPTCTVESEAWTGMIRHLLDAESLYRSGHLCDFYLSLQETDPPPANLETVLDQLEDAEQLCS